MRWVSFFGHGEGTDKREEEVSLCGACAHIGRCCHGPAPSLSLLTSAEYQVPSTEYRVLSGAGQDVGSWVGSPLGCRVVCILGGLLVVELQLNGLWRG